jgi:hypothetical protein
MAEDEPMSQGLEPGTNAPGIAAGQRRLPGRGEVVTFLEHLRKPTRGTTLRGAIDGMYVSWVLKKRGMRTLLESGGSPAARVDAERARSVATAVDAGFGLLPLAPTCLRRSLTLMRELNRKDLTATVHFGVRTSRSKVEAHAWVQVGEVVVNDDPAVTNTYSELASGELETFLSILQ